jgi:hypothetical protein
MNQLLKTTTKKLFFRKWIYKLTVQVENASYIKKIHFSNNYLKSLGRDTSKLIEICFLLEQWKDEYDFKTRCECNHLSFFTNDEKFLALLEDHFDSNIIEISSPKDINCANFLKNNSNIIITEKLPRNLYRYKVYFDSKYRINGDVSKNFVSWASKYDKQMLISPGLKKAMSSDKGFWPYNNYFYVTDEKLLGMAVMFLGKHVGVVEKYALKTEINE